MSKDHVLTLLEKAAATPTADAAMKFAQAALNAANALCSLETVKRIDSRE